MVNLFKRCQPKPNEKKTTRKETSPKQADNREPQQNYRTTALKRSVTNYFFLWGGGGGVKLVLRAQPHPQFLKWYTLLYDSWLLDSRDNLSTNHHGTCKQINHVLIQ